MKFKHYKHFKNFYDFGAKYGTLNLQFVKQNYDSLSSLVIFECNDGIKLGLYNCFTLWEKFKNSLNGLSVSQERTLKYMRA